MTWRYLDHATHVHISIYDDMNFYCGRIVMPAQYFNELRNDPNAQQLITFKDLQAPCQNQLTS